MTQEQNKGRAVPQQDNKPSPTPDPNTVNHGNQLNKHHRAYWQSRGVPMPTDPKDRR